MIKYILKRIVQVIPVLLGVSIIVFLMLSLSPGDPARLACASWSSMCCPTPSVR